MQALVLLNDPQYVEASRHFAQKLLSMDADSDDDRLNLAFETILSRKPDREELKILQSRLADERTYYADAPEKASAYLTVGESTPDPTINTQELAAWTTVASMIFNLSEAITRS